MESVVKDFWKNRRVLVTGHTGFKGGWLTTWLLSMGAEVYGYGLLPQTWPSFYDSANIEVKLNNRSVLGDLSDLRRITSWISFAQPSVVFHLAAQPIVRYSYDNPIETFQTNVMGTINVLEGIRITPSVEAAVIVTTDKCYRNDEKSTGYVETDPLGGSDPYSASKAAAELAVSAYSKSFFSAPDTANIASVRAGNVIGGGDWSVDRLIPDAVRAIQSKKQLILRSPEAIRPWQHAMDVLAGYLMLAQALVTDRKYSGPWNFGPDAENITVSELLHKFYYSYGQEFSPIIVPEETKIETLRLNLDSNKAKVELNWNPKLSIGESLGFTAAWYQRWYQNELIPADMFQVTKEQIDSYCGYYTI